MTRINLSGVLEDGDPELVSLPTESGWRTRATADLREHLRHYLSDYGITRVAHLTGFDRVGLPVYMAVKPQGRSLSSGSGKGSTHDAAWVSAVMECAEQSIWESVAHEEIVASERSLQRLGVSALDAGRLPLVVGADYRPDWPIAWVRGWDIVQSEHVWVPRDLVQISQEPATGTSTGLQPFVTSTNGLASGAHVAEAVLSGLQEVIERDGLVVASIPDPTPGLSAWSLLTTTAPAVADRIDRTGLRLQVKDCTTEIGVPTIAAYLYDDEGGAGTFKGVGAGTDVATALVRAVTEAAQARCLIIAGARDDVFESARSAGVGMRPQAPGQPLPELSTGASPAIGSVLDAIEWMVERLGDQGFDRVAVVRHTRPGDPVQAVRVVVPGLEGYPFAHAAWGARARAAAAAAADGEMTA
jgi:YcaO-like protein with predicted kinase domain